MKLIKFIFRHFFSILLLAVVGVIIFTSTAPASSSRVEGIGIDLMSTPPISQEVVENQLSAIQQSGAEYVRVEVNWTLIESIEDIYDWSNAVPLDLFFASAKSHGLKAVAVITGFPVYLSSYGTSLDQAVVGGRWEKFIEAAALHFGEQVDFWQIGDQINSSLSVRSLANADPRFYAKMLISASKIIKRVDSSDQVWMGSLVSATAADCAVNPLTFLLELNGENAWKSADVLTYQPRRGATLPENPSENEVNPGCSSSMPGNAVSLSAEVQSVQDLARQLGGKTVYVTGLGWSDVELLELQNGRSVDLAALESDLLVRASTIIIGSNSIPLILWDIDPMSEPFLMASIGNLSATVAGATSQGQIQGQNGSMEEFRFQKGAALNVLAWRSQDGDAAQPVRFDNLTPGEMTAFSSNAVNLSKEMGTAIQVDDAGSTIMMLNERPIILAGKNGGWDDQVKATVLDQLDSWRGSIRSVIAGWVNQRKVVVVTWLDGLFTQAKDSAVNWGEEKINDLFN